MTIQLDSDLLQWEQTHPPTSGEAAGIKTYNCILGFFAWIVGQALWCKAAGHTYFVNKQSAKDFFTRHDQDDVNAMGNEQIKDLVELVAENLASKKTEILPQKISFQPVFKPFSQTTPTVSQLITEFKGMPWQKNLLYKNEPVEGYQVQNPEENKKRLLNIVKEHNTQFNQESLKETDAGYIQKISSENNTKIYVRADLHSDLKSLLAQLAMLQEEGLLDKNYHCKEGFHMVFLGDITDRGVNDIELLSLLLTLRMENPESVHIVRGNHEDVNIQAKYSQEGKFFVDNSDVFEKCYRTFPIALCWRGEEKNREKEYVHLSHGLFSPAVNLGKFLLGEESALVLSKDLFHSFNVQKTITPKTLKAQEQMEKLPEQAKGFEGYVWSDITHSITGPSPRGAGYKYTPEDIHEYARAAGAKGARIKYFLRGHQHDFAEETIERKGKHKQAKGLFKVIATTLAIGTAGGAYKKSVGEKPIQGMMLTVQSKVSDWTKTAAIFQKGKLHLSEQSTKMYEAALIPAIPPEPIPDSQAEEKTSGLSGRLSALGEKVQKALHWFF